MQQRKLQYSAPEESPNFSPLSFCLKFVDDGFGTRKSLQFEAIDASKALFIAQKEAPNRRAELWCDGRKVCNICHTEAGIWEIRY